MKRFCLILALSLTTSAQAQTTQAPPAVVDATAGSDRQPIILPVILGAVVLLALISASD